MGFDFSEFEKKLVLISAFKRAQPIDFFSAYKIALELGIVKNQTILEALEVYAAEKRTNGVQ